MYSTCGSLYMKDWAVSNLGVRDLGYQAHLLVDSTLPALNS
jgi:hypothetical protein